MTWIKRLHLAEFCDQPWVAGWMREGFMDCLSLIYIFFRPYHGFAENILSDMQGTRVYDLATGGGEAATFLLKELSRKAAGDAGDAINIIGTDLHPDTESLEYMKKKYPHFDYIAESVSAFDPPADENCAYTMFTALHHFREEDAVKIIRAALNKGKSFTVFEMTLRDNIPGYLTMPLGIPLFMLAPFFARKWRWQKLLLSLIPVIPLIVVFDGLVSNLRTYTKAELEDLAHQAFPDRSVRVDFQTGGNLFVKSYMCRFSFDV